MSEEIKKKGRPVGIPAWNRGIPATNRKTTRNNQIILLHQSNPNLSIEQIAEQFQLSRQRVYVILKASF